MQRINETFFPKPIHSALGSRTGLQRAANPVPHAAGSLIACPALTRWIPAVVFLFTAGISQAQISQTEVTQLASVSVPTEHPTAGIGMARVEALLNKIPLSFEANRGQFDQRVKFVARGPNQNLFLTAEGMVLALEKQGASEPVVNVVRIQFEGASTKTNFAGLDQLAAITNYFGAGRNITNVPNYASVRQLDVYPGIDVVYYGNQGRLEHDFMVFPGADAGIIKLRLSGHDSASVSASGDLLLKTNAGELKLHKPIAYQDRDGDRAEVAVRYVLAGDRVQFEVGDYDRTRPLIIDPILSYSTIISSATFAHAIALDSNRNVYLTGRTSATNFPVVSGVQSKLAGDISAFVTKLDASGGGVVYSTYLGGKNGVNYGYGITVDASGNAYVTGWTNSSAFPVTNGAWSTSNQSGLLSGFVTKLAPQGNALVYSTYVPNKASAAIAVDVSGNAYIAIGRKDVDTLTNSGVVKLNATGTAPVYVMDFPAPSSARGIAIDAAGHAYVTGFTRSATFPVVNAYQASLNGTQDAFITKLDPTGSSLVYSTYLGGSLGESGNAIAVDSQGNAHIAGTTYSANFPVLRAFQSTKAYVGSGHEGINQAFISKLNAAGNALVYSSYLGGQSCLGPGIFSCQPDGDDDSAQAIALDAAGNAYLAGYARSIVFPQIDRIQGSLTPYGLSVPFVAKVQDRSPFATLIYSVGLGAKSVEQFGDGAAAGVAVDANGNAYVAGYHVDLFPTTPGAYKAAAALANNGAQAFVFKVSPGKFTTGLTSSHATPTSADTVTLTAAVNNAAPGGTVTFHSNGNAIGTAAVSEWSAALTTTLVPGVHQLTAVYSGDNKVSPPLFLPVKQALICN